MRCLLSTLSSLALAGSSLAANIAINNTISAADSSNFHYSDSTTTVRLKDSAGVILPAGTDFRIGYFKGYTPTLNIMLATSSFASLTSPSNANGFVPIGVGTPGTGDDVRANMEIRDFSGTLRTITTVPNVSYLTGTPNTEGAGLTRGTKLFLFLLNQADFSGSPTEWGIFSATTWEIPASGGADLTLAFKEVDTIGEVFRGKLGSLGTAVPEPTSSILALGAVLFGVRRRRP